MENSPTTTGNVPTSPIIISDCGILSPDDPSLAEEDPSQPAAPVEPDPPSTPDPSTPSQPSAPAQPATPTAPAEPSTPSQPVAPTDPGAPTDVPAPPLSAEEEIKNLRLELAAAKEALGTALEVASHARQRAAEVEEEVFKNLQDILQEVDKAKKGMDEAIESTKEEAKTARDAVNAADEEAARWRDAANEAGVELERVKLDLAAAKQPTNVNGEPTRGRTPLSYLCRSILPTTEDVSSNNPAIFTPKRLWPNGQVIKNKT